MAQKLSSETPDGNLFQPQQLEFSPLRRMRVQAVFDEPELSSDGGALLLREAAEGNGIVAAMAESIRDSRDQDHVQHTMNELLNQRVIQICHGYEDANDCDVLRNDSIFKVAAGRRPNDDPLGSQPTMSRLENRVNLRDLIRIFYAFLDNFIESFESEPECLTLDMDPTPNRVYGGQQLGLFNAHYDEYCLMPFHVYEGQTGRLITTVIRPGKTPTDREIIALLKRIVRRVRQRFPNTMLIFRADSHHNKPAVLEWLEAHNVRYVLGMSTNAVLRWEVQDIVEQLAKTQREGMNKYRRFHSFEYAAGSWSIKRRMIARIEASSLGVDVRFIVTDLKGAGAKFLYETVYCGRGNAELMIKEHKCFLKSSRTSCTSLLANQFRLFLHSAAYVIMHGMKETLLQGTTLSKATFQTIQLRLLKIAARVEVGKTFVRFHLPSSSPAAKLFQGAAQMVSAIRIT